MIFVVYSLGCKVNQYEGQAMVKRLEDMGQRAVTDLQPADAYILNTCSITAEADKKSRQLIAKANRLNPYAPIYVCGCSSQYAKEQYESKHNVHLIAGTSDKIAFIDRIISDIDAGFAVSKSFVNQPPRVYQDDMLSKSTRTRTYIKIQDGCNRFCSYCIVPYLRGRSRSRPMKSVIEEAHIAAAHSKELVLTGIDLSAYGKDIGTDLTDLIVKLESIRARKRLGSLECSVITPDLLRAMDRSGFCDHFHLSLQSGCDTVLRRMNRHYTIDAFYEKVMMIRERFPDAGIATDIITGFPEETEEEHQSSLDNVERLGFSDIHVFPYSQRKGTAADRMRQILPEIRFGRAEEFAALKRRLHERFVRSQCGKAHTVYLESSEAGLAAGYTENYIKTYVDSNAVHMETMVSVRLGAPYLNGVKGDLL